jgi:AhpD family alkylhydroperoxidase
MQHPAMIVPGAYQALQDLSKAAAKVGLPPELLEMMNLRASQINGCGFCVDMHSRALKKAGESDERIWGIGAWRDTPFYSEAERAAFALTEAATRIADRPDPVTDDIWDDARKHYDEQQLAALLLTIAGINVWNRLNVSTHTLAGSH